MEPMPTELELDPMQDAATLRCALVTRIEESILDELAIHGRVHAASAWRIDTRPGARLLRMCIDQVLDDITTQVLVRADGQHWLTFPPRLLLERLGLATREG